MSWQQRAALSGGVMTILMALSIVMAPMALGASASHVSTSQTRTAATCPQLPKDFDPLTAPLSEIRAFRLPPPPSDPAQLADWASRMRKIKRIVCDSDFTHVNVPISQPVMMSSTGPLITNVFPTADSENWAGYVAHAGPFDDVKGSWPIQTLGQYLGEGEHLITWVGIGGTNGGNLVQTGSMYTAVAINGHQTGFYPYFESTTGGASFDFNDPLAPGTVMVAEVYYATYPIAQWCTDLSWGSNTYPTCFPSSYTADQSTAEWIDERPHCTNGLSKLADFVKTDLSNASAHSTARGWHTMAGSNPYATTMRDYESFNNPPLAIPQNPPKTATEFIDTWKGFGNVTGCYDYK